MDDTSGSSLVHYHVVTIVPESAGFSHFRDIAHDMNELKEKFDKRVQMIRDLTGCNVIEDQTEYFVRFVNGGKVNWTPCIGTDCATRTTYNKFPYPASMRTQR